MMIWPLGDCRNFEIDIKSCYYLLIWGYLIVKLVYSNLSQFQQTHVKVNVI
jgi:hypothetical protein